MLDKQLNGKYHNNINNKKGGHRIITDRYSIEEVICNHEDAKVLRAVHRQLGSKRLLKGIRKTSPFYSRFMEEAFLLQSLNYPGIPEIIDLEDDDNYTFIIEQFIDGRSLLDFCRERYPSRREFFNILFQICDILTYLHSREIPIIYLDLKPDNIMLDKDNRAWLVDYGSSKPALSVGQEPSHGTAAYAAPEQKYSVNADVRTDIYGLGSLMRFMLYGMDIPIRDRKKLAALYEACMSSAPWRRPSSVAKVKGRLERIAGDSFRNIYASIAVAGAGSNLGTTHLALIIADHLSRNGEKVRYSEAHEDFVISTLRRIGKMEYGGVILRDYREYLKDLEKIHRESEIVMDELRADSFFGNDNGKGGICEVYDCGEICNHMPPCFYDAELVIILIGTAPWDSREAAVAEQLSRDVGNRLFFCSKGEKPEYDLNGVPPECIIGFKDVRWDIKDSQEKMEELLDEIISKR